jgi:hypothetical protein
MSKLNQATPRFLEPVECTLENQGLVQHAWILSFEQENKKQKIWRHTPNAIAI